MRKNYRKLSVRIGVGAAGFLPFFVGNHLARILIPLIVVCESAALGMLIGRTPGYHRNFWMALWLSNVFACGWAAAFMMRPVLHNGPLTPLTFSMYFFAVLSTIAQVVAACLWARPLMPFRQLRWPILIAAGAFISATAANQTLQPWLMHERVANRTSAALIGVQVVSAFALLCAVAIVGKKLVALERRSDLLLLCATATFVLVSAATLLLRGMNQGVATLWLGPIQGFAIALAAAGAPSMTLVARPIQPLPPTSRPLILPSVLAALLVSNPLVAWLLSLRTPPSWLLPGFVALSLVEGAALALIAGAYLRAMKQRPQPTANVARRRDLLRDLPHALVNGEILAYYQPITNAATGERCGYEALARWEHPRYGTLSADEFIGLIAVGGYLKMFDRLIVLEVGAKLSHLMTTLKVPEAFVTVNVSTTQMECEGFAQQILAEFAAKGYDPAGLVVEISESARVSSWPRLLSNVAVFRDARVAMAIDDFGAGFANLATLTRFDPEFVKLDKVLVHAAMDSPAGKALAIAAVDAARSCGATVIAEGVEDAAWAGELSQAGIDYLQGYGVGGPAIRVNVDTVPISRTAVRAAVPVLAERMIGARWIGRPGSFWGLHPAKRPRTAPTLYAAEPGDA